MQIKKRKKGKNTQYTTTKNIDAMFVHASHGYQCLNNKYEFSCMWH